jgi:hypothetical protein
MNHAVVTTAARDLAIVTTVQARISEPAWSNPGDLLVAYPGVTHARELGLSTLVNNCMFPDRGGGMGAERLYR